MNPHILFFDIDGTLMDEETGCITDRTKEALQEARKNGHYTFLNTGRSFAELDPEVVNVGFDGVVCGCGTYIEYHGENLMKHSIHGDEAVDMVKTITECKMDAILEGDHHFYVSKNASERKLLAVKEYFGEKVNQKCRFWEDRIPQFQKMSIWLSEDSDFGRFQKKYEKKFDFIKRASRFYEVVPKGYSKATGIEFLMNYLGIEQEHTMAIGDSTNDLAMLEYATISIAMGNSKDIVKERVAFVTKTVKEEGVAYALSHYGFV